MSTSRQISITLSAHIWEQVGRFARLFVAAAGAPLLALQVSGQLTANHAGLAAAEGALVGAAEVAWRAFNKTAPVVDSGAVSALSAVVDASVSNKAP